MIGTTLLQGRRRRWAGPPGFSADQNCSCEKPDDAVVEGDIAISGNQVFRARHLEHFRLRHELQQFGNTFIIHDIAVAAAHQACRDLHTWGGIK